MKKLFGLLILSCTLPLSAQYMIVGKDSISVEQFKKENRYALENNGIDKTVSAMQNFYLYQQFAAEKRADTLAYFREKMTAKEVELRNKYFFPPEVVNPVLQDFLKDSKTEREVQIFILEKSAEDKTDYRSVYDEVRSGKLAMSEAISRYTKGNPSSIFVKPGSIDNQLYSEIKKLGDNGVTEFYDTPSYIAFAKVISTRPSLGYVVFGTISYPAGDNAQSTKNAVYKELNAGKKFQEVARMYGGTDHEKENGGIVLGSPTLPPEVYQLFKGKKAGYYTPEPVLMGDKYFIFHIYSIEPYELSEKNTAFFLRELKNSLYAEILQDRMSTHLKSQSSYKEFPAFKKVKKSLSDLLSMPEGERLYQYMDYTLTAGDLKKVFTERKAEAEKLSAHQWSEVVDNYTNQDVLRIYSKNFTSLKQVNEELNTLRKSLYSDYIFSKYVNEQIDAHLEWLTEYYNRNKSKFVLEERADGRVAIFSDSHLLKTLTSELKDPAKWDSVKTKFADSSVNFEKGEMMKDAEIFNRYGVPFRTGVHHVKMGNKTLVIAIDRILPAGQMSLKEAETEVRDGVTEEKLNEIIQTQKSKTKIMVEPAFLKDLEKNFKK